MFRDGLGERRSVPDPAGNGTVELLCLRGELTAVPAFEFALRERLSHLAPFRHAYFGRARSVERLNDRPATLALVSDAVDGVRLSDLLEVAERRNLPIDINASLCLIRQLVPAVAALHEAAPQASHGAIAPERIIITPNARVLLVEYVLGAALEQLRFSQERYWKDLRVVTAGVGGPARLDQRTDVAAVGLVALALIVGRPLHDDEFPGRLAGVLGSAWAMSARGGYEPLPHGLRAWLARTLQLDPRNPFHTMGDAQEELDRVHGDSDYVAAPAALEAVLAQYRELAAPPEPAAHPIAAPLPWAVNDSPAAQSTVTVLADAVAPARTIAPPPPSRPAPRDPAIAAPARTLVPPPVAPQRQAPVTYDTPDDDEIDEPPAASRRWMPWGAAAVIVAAVLAGGAFAARPYLFAPAHAPSGTVAVTSNPAGAQVLIDGVLRGTTPATLTVAPGGHTLLVRGDGVEPRVIPITVADGAQLSQYLDLPKAAPATAQLEVRTDPPGAQVSVDGVARGASPLTLTDLVPGVHTVSVAGDLGKVEQSVNVAAGTASSVLVPLAAPRGAPVSGWMTVSAPADLQLYENGKLLGTSQMDRLMVPVGTHQIDLVNETLGYRAKKSVTVEPGRVTPITVEFPKATIALNAIPWADVWIDGERVGQTPLGNVQVSIGPHQVLFRNPDLGEKNQTVVVSLATPTRLSVDMRKK